MRRTAAVIVSVLALALAWASEAQAHVLTQGTADSIAERYNRQAFAGMRWAEEWGSECSRETPWTFSCNAQVWSTARWCWQWFNVVQPYFGVFGRARIEDLEPWTCE